MNNGMRDNDNTKKVHVIGVVPPPLNGMTLVTSQIAQRLDHTGHGQLRTISGSLRGLRWTAWKHLGFMFQLFAASLRSRGRDRCYFIPDSGAGLWLNIPEALILRLGFSEVWLHHHVFSYVRKRDLRMALILRLIGSKARHIVLGQAMAKGLEHHYSANQLTILNNANFVVDAPTGHVRKSLSCVGFLGNITRSKGIALYMDTLRQLEASGNPVQALIAGPIKDLDLRREIEAFCAEKPDARKWIGPVKGAEKQSFFNQIDTLLFPSLYANEALPVTIYEALAAGIPVLATDRGCISEQLSGLDFILPETEFSTTAADQLAKWQRSPNEFSKASVEAQRQYEDQLSAAKIALERMIAMMTSENRQ